MDLSEFENNFFGRREILTLLKRRVKDLKDGYRQNIAFIGPRYIGKSSIINKFIFELDDEDIFVIYFDLEEKDFNYFFYKFAGGILYQFLKSKKFPLYNDLNLLLESAAPYLPKTVENIKNIQKEILSGKIFEAYLSLISLPEIFTAETRKFCILIFDEFHNLEEFSALQIFQELGKKIMTQKKCLYIMTSSLQGLAKKILSEKLSLLFGNFEVIDIGPWDIRTSQEFIDNKLKNIQIGNLLKNSLIDFTGGHPLYLNLISHELIYLCAIHKQQEIFVPLLTQAIENTIFDSWGTLARHFEFMISKLASGKGNHSVLPIIISLAKGQHKLKDLIDDTRLKQSLIKQKINRLIEADIVVKNGTFYYLKDKLFKYWVKYIYQRKLKTIEFDFKNQRDEFKEEFNQYLINFKLNSAQKLSTRIVDLLQCFDNEALDMNGRRYRLPLFREIAPVQLRSLEESHFDVLKATCDEGYWFIILKNDTILENDVNFFIEEAKRMGEKPTKCLIISLGNLEDTAKLKALQERVWIWNELELNTLLNLYNKPYIII